MKRFLPLLLAALIVLMLQQSALQGRLMPRTAMAAAQVASVCGLSAPAFCDTFNAPAGIGNRSGQLNGTVWGASRTSQNTNPIGGSMPNQWFPSQQNQCGASQSVLPEHDITVCNGQLVESVNDGYSFGSGAVTVLAMYPKQPFDIAGRTGIATFDVSDDTQGSHAAWPEFAYSDQPVPAPRENLPAENPYPRNGFGFSLAGLCGTGTSCGGNNSGGSGATCVTVDGMWISRNFQLSTPAFTQLGCVQQPKTAGQLNHFEVHISQNDVQVWGTDAGTTAPLFEIAELMGANLPLTRGLIWIEDVHYNACKFNSQCDHTFTWDNVGFDGPVLPRDLAFDVLDANQSQSSGSEYLGWGLTPGNTITLSTLPVSGVAQASAALLTLSYFDSNTLTYSINGHTQHTQSPPNTTGGWMTQALPVPLAEVQTGVNTIALSSSGNTVIANVDLIMVGAGGIPCSPDPSVPCSSTTLRGDVNGDGVVNSTDALCVLLIVAGLPSNPPGCPIPPPGNPDVDSDGQVTSADALCILRLAAQLPSTSGCSATGTASPSAAPPSPPRQSRVGGPPRTRVVPT